MVATALKNAFTNKGYNNVHVVDLFTEAHPYITDTIKKAYLKSYDFGQAYSLLYYGSEKLVDKKIIQLYRYFGLKRLSDISRELKPDIIINTFPILASLKVTNDKGENIPVFNIVTDFYVHKLWLSDQIDKYYIATDELQEELHKMNIPIEKTVVTGIPIREAFEEMENLSSIFKKYNFNKSKQIVLINGGAFGVLKEIKNICIGLGQNRDIQVAVICGNNLGLKKELEGLKIQNLIVFGFIENIHELYKISTCMITKPGGITLSEALAVQLPLIIFKPVPGQEKENALFFERKGAAMVAYSTDEIVNYTLDLLSNHSILNAMKQNMRKLYSKSSSELIVDDVVESIEK
jgi:processive 1,2-diacylglycerol beta-glucosyltransferase